MFSAGNMLFYGNFGDYEDFMTYGDWCLVFTNTHAQHQHLVGNSWFWRKTEVILILKSITSKYGQIVSKESIVRCF